MSEPKKKRPVTPVEFLLDGKTLCVHDEDFASDYPKVHKMLWPQYTDGVLSRSAAVIRLKQVGGSVMISVDCPTERVTVDLSVERLSSLWEEMEKCLHDGRIIQRPIWTPGKRKAPEVEDLYE